MQPDPRRARLRAILAGAQCVTAGSVFDPMSARIADHVGFEVGLMGGSVASFAVLGDPDLALITMTELAEQARRVCRAGRLAVLVDADHGYGNALNVARTIEELAAAGVAGATIEDTLLPAPFRDGPARQLIALEEGVGKMKAAVRAASASGLVVMGRTSAATLHGVDEAIRRLQAYEAAGVDALFLPGLRTREELDAIAAAVRTPLVLAGCHQSLADPAYLAGRGVRLWMAGHQPFAAAVQAMVDTMRAIRAGAAPADLARIAPPELMAQLTRADAYEALRREYGLQ